MIVPYLIQFAQHIDNRGILIFGEVGSELPFTVKRAFWILHASSLATRGGHAHNECHQFLIALKGSVLVETNIASYTLASPHIGLYVPPKNSITLSEFAKDSIILVLCSHKYDKEDYIYDQIC